MDEGIHLFADGWITKGVIFSIIKIDPIACASNAAQYILLFGTYIIKIVGYFLIVVNDLISYLSRYDRLFSVFLCLLQFHSTRCLVRPYFRLFLKLLRYQEIPAYSRQCVRPVWYIRMFRLLLS